MSDKSPFGAAHASFDKVIDKNYNEMLKFTLFNIEMPRLRAATLLTGHGFDHYGQLVVYGRMLGIVPPASKQQ